MNQIHRRLSRWALTLLFALLAIVFSATAASAHATLVTSNPSNGDVIDAAPDSVKVEFSEPIVLGAGYFRVLNEDGKRVDTGNVSVDGEFLSVTLPKGLKDGGYIATYRVISDDSHPISGAVSFAVGNATPPELDGDGAKLAGGGEDPVVSVLYPTVRWIGYSGLALIAGALLLGLIDPALRATKALRRWAWIGLDAALGATLLGGLLQGPYAAGQGIGSLLSPSLVSATLDTEVGRMVSLRLVLLGVLGVLLWEWLNAQRDRRRLIWASAAIVTAAAATHAASGHAVSDALPWLTITAGAAHLTSAAAWLGGIAMLLLVVLTTAGGLSVGERRAVVRRFSRIAPWLVGIIIVTGVAESWVRVGSWGALLGTAYGKLLIAKSALLAVALGAAMVARRVLGDVRVQNRGSLRKAVLVEAAAGAVAIAVAAVLVATPPARDTYQVARDTRIAFDNGYSAQTSLDPARKGSNVMHIYLFDRNNALASEVQEAKVTVRNEANQIGPLEVTARYVGQGHFTVSPVDLPTSGKWVVSMTFTEPGFGTVTAEGSIDVS